MKCPICKNEELTVVDICSNCGFNQLSKEFINQEELEHWIKETVIPCQSIYRTMLVKLSTASQNPEVNFQPMAITSNGCGGDIVTDFKDFQYFDYEEETGIITDYHGKRIQCLELQKYVDNGLRIVGYNGFEADRVVVPNEINGRKVISIGEKVFMNTSLSEVVLPTSLKAILKNAFDGCKNLKRISLPEEITYIGENCFQNSGLEEFFCPKSTRIIPHGCFARCSQLHKVILDAPISKLEYHAFYGCENLSEITLPESLIEIENASFENTAIKAIIIPRNVQKMHIEAFGSGTWRLTAKHKHEVVCAFLGMETEIFKTLWSQSHLNRVSLVYCLPGSKIQKIARENLIQIKHLREFRLEDYQ